jgi:hypothetical protein
VRRTTLFTLEVRLTGGNMTHEFLARNPVISRTIQIRADQTLNQLHKMIFEAFGRWDDAHLSQFNLGTGVLDRTGDRYVPQFIYDAPLEEGEEPATGSMTQTRIGVLRPQLGQVLWYWFDFGDDWVHRITVIAIGEADPRVRYPRVTRRIGESPPQSPLMSEGGTAKGAVEQGRTDLGDGEAVAWTRRQVTEEEGWSVRLDAQNRTYRVTTICDRLDWTTVVTTYLVPGLWLALWLAEPRGTEEEPETVLSVEAV